MSDDASGPACSVPSARPARWRGWARWLLLIPFFVLLYPPLYAREHPKVAGIPFYLWYQLVWIVLSGAITGIVYLLHRAEDGRAE